MHGAVLILLCTLDLLSSVVAPAVTSLPETFAVHSLEAPDIAKPAALMDDASDLAKLSSPKPSISDISLGSEFESSRSSSASPVKERRTTIQALSAKLRGWVSRFKAFISRWVKSVSPFRTQKAEKISSNPKVHPGSSETAFIPTSPSSIITHQKTSAPPKLLPQPSEKQIPSADAIGAHPADLAINPSSEKPIETKTAEASGWDWMLPSPVRNSETWKWMANAENQFSPAGRLREWATSTNDLYLRIGGFLKWGTDAKQGARLEGGLEALPLTGAPYKDALNYIEQELKSFAKNHQSSESVTETIKSLRKIIKSLDSPSNPEAVKSSESLLNEKVPTPETAKLGKLDSPELHSGELSPSHPKEPLPTDDKLVNSVREILRKRFPPPDLAPIYLSFGADAIRMNADEAEVDLVLAKLLYVLAQDGSPAAQLELDSLGRGLAVVSSTAQTAEVSDRLNSLKVFVNAALKKLNS